MQEGKNLEANSIFAIIPQQMIEIVKSEEVLLQSCFLLNRNQTQQVKLALTANHILICQPGWFKQPYHYYTNYQYELKFEVVYEKQENQESSIYSRMLGFRLVQAGAQTVEFTIIQDKFIQVWIKYLGRCLNQLGFHRLYKPVKKLGKGGFATVYEVQRLTDRRHFAAKAFSKQNTMNSQNVSHRLTLLNEIGIMRALDSPHVIKLQGVFQSDKSLYVILELVSSGQLHSRINSREGTFTLGEIRQFMIGLAKGLKEIHDKGIMHRDIKPQNIMMRNQNNMEPIIVDFGLAAFINSDDYIFYRCGTPGYVAPEITALVKGQKVDSVCDIFSAGAIFHILLTRKTLFEGRKFEEVYQNNRKMRFNLNSMQYSQVDREAMDLLGKMLKVDPRQRIRAHEILQHPFLYGW